MHRDPYRFDPEELKARFNPEGSPLRLQQLRMKEMLKVLDGICRKHDIPYWIASGTLLGCMRHGGFIPWDDDLDVEMLRSDYKRLLRILPRELPEWMELQHRDTDPNYFYSYAKLRDKNSLLEETNGYDRIFRMKGIYIDIFPQEKCPLWMQKLSCHTLGHVYKVMKDMRISEPERLKKVAFWYNLNHRLIYPLMRLASLLFPSLLVRHTFGVPFHTACHVDEVFPIGRAKFEDLEVSVPHDSDAYLKRKYGDYLRMPDVDALNPHVAQCRFF
ncbi:MAG: LicD family protein [Bacteroidaceae bacterium]|nr:LicD family protein [Bacteroidaceae bacterium]